MDISKLSSMARKLTEWWMQQMTKISKFPEFRNFRHWLHSSFSDHMYMCIPMCALVCVQSCTYTLQKCIYKKIQHKQYPELMKTLGTISLILLVLSIPPKTYVIHGLHSGSIQWQANMVPGVAIPPCWSTTPELTIQELRRESWLYSQDLSLSKVQTFKSRI